MKNEKKIFTFKESESTIWFLELLESGRQWAMWAERDGKQIFGSLEIKKRLSKDHKEMFNITK